MKVKKGFKRHQQGSDVYMIKYCIPPDYGVDHYIQKTGSYAYVRHCSMLMAASGNCIILDIFKKSDGETPRPEKL